MIASEHMASHWRKMRDLFGWVPMIASSIGIANASTRDWILLGTVSML